MFSNPTNIICVVSTSQKKYGCCIFVRQFDPSIYTNTSFFSGQDGETEKRSIFIDLDFYVPPDERFSPVKLSEFITHSIQAVLHFVFPEVKSLLGHDIGNFESFKELTKDLYARPHEPSIVEGVVMEKLKSLLPKDIYKEVIRVMKENPLKFPVPQVIASEPVSPKH